MHSAIFSRRSSTPADSGNAPPQQSSTRQVAPFHHGACDCGDPNHHAEGDASAADQNGEEDVAPLCPVSRERTVADRDVGRAGDRGEIEPIARPHRDNILTTSGEERGGFG
ncbi:hypothetical protein R8Z57_10795 [Microbacterium sp. M3]|uniref:Uncharacterized protein n=1 Tax=Microbacterium arthrosphaerae TaxID=792652 RepID=A0ABU4H1P0_9MICO|nr:MULTISPECIES: hypothetical protein [Microbacterium]MDW4573257.1 hypothetical protein [Microbacterium arthrosphaerae]MDW7607112.1 hypothetical protein [Microbacterium sp. M3]